jgi:uncharacterized protein YbjT (DUF2867 family)
VTNRILITGATGNVGAAALQSLLRLRQPTDNVTIIAGLRDPVNDLPRLTYQPDAVVKLDFEAVSTFDAALAGVTRVLLVRPPRLADVDKYFKPFVAAMVRAGVQHVAFLSLQGVENNPVTPHHKIEKLIREAGGRKATPPTLRLGYTMLRPSFFMQNLSTTHRDEIRDRDEIFVPAGQGRTSFVDVRDVGEVAALSLLHPDQHRNQAYELTGSDALTYTEVAQILTDVLNRRIRYTNPSMLRFVWWKWQTEKEDLGFVLIMLALYTVAKLGKAADLTTETARLLGRPPISFRQFAEDTKAVWIP